MESIQIIAAAVAQVKRNAQLGFLPVSSTRPPAGQVNPSGTLYCVVEVSLLKRKFSSANYRVSEYLLTFTLYGGQDKGEIDATAELIDKQFDRNIGLPVDDDCYVLGVFATEENPVTSPDDYYGLDVNILRQSYRVLLSETQPAIYSALAT